MPVPPRRWHRYVALGDSLTEGLCDPAPDGALRGWADRLALLLAARGGLHYANLAIRSKRVGDVCGTQLERALELRPDLVSILIGANDLVKHRVNVAALAQRLEDAVVRLRGIGADVVLVTPFLPGRRAASIYTRRFSAFATALAGIAARTGAILIDTDLHPSLPDRPNWGEDLVHLSSRGHRFLAYRAAEVLGVPDADALGVLDAALHENETIGAACVVAAACPAVGLAPSARSSRGRRPLGEARRLRLPRPILRGPRGVRQLTGLPQRRPMP